VLSLCSGDIETDLAAALEGINHAIGR